MRQRHNRPAHPPKNVVPPHVGVDPPARKPLDAPLNSKNKHKQSPSNQNLSSLVVPKRSKMPVPDQVPKEKRVLPGLDSPAVQNPCALLAYGGIVAWCISRGVRHLVPEASHTLANSLGDFPYTLVAVPVLTKFVTTDGGKFKAETALGISVTLLVLAETGQLGILGGHSDPLDIPAGLVGAAFGYILGRDGIRSMLKKAFLFEYFSSRKNTT